MDNKNKVVFNGSDLGKGYSAAALQNQFGSSNSNSLDDEQTKTVTNSNHLVQRINLTNVRKEPTQ